MVRSGILSGSLGLNGLDSARRGSCLAIASSKAGIAASFEGKIPSSVSTSGLSRWTTTSFTLSMIVVMSDLTIGRGARTGLATRLAYSSLLAFKRSMGMEAAAMRSSLAIFLSPENVATDVWFLPRNGPPLRRLQRGQSVGGA
jgi:hypothetical protein